MTDPLTNVEAGSTSRQSAGDGGEGNLEQRTAYPAWRTYEQREYEQNRELASARIQEVSV